MSIGRAVRVRPRSSVWHGSCRPKNGSIMRSESGAPPRATSLGCRPLLRHPRVSPSLALSGPPTLPSELMESRTVEREGEEGRARREKHEKDPRGIDYTRSPICSTAVTAYQVGQVVNFVL